MARLALGVEYEGTSYCGWQIQRNQPSVQAAIEQAMSKVAQHPIKITACGRTDTGVHALGQVIHTDVSVARPDDAWVRGVNSYLPKDIRILWVKNVDEEFHARYKALNRRYLYLIHSSKISPGILGQGVTWVHYELSIELMQVAANYLLGEHDFSSFRAAGCQSKTAVRHIKSISVRQAQQLILIDVTANAFLHHMVRNIVGTLLCVGKGIMLPIAVKELLEKRNRQLAPQMALANGLYLLHAEYPLEYRLPQTVNYPWFFGKNSIELV